MLCAVGVGRFGEYWCASAWRGGRATPRVSYDRHFAFDGPDNMMMTPAQGKSSIITEMNPSARIDS